MTSAEGLVATGDDVPRFEPAGAPPDDLAHHVETVGHAMAKWRTALRQRARRFSFFSGIALPVIDITWHRQCLM
jgi:hypothetical protein